MLSCEKPADGIIINPPIKPTTPTTPTTPENPEQPQDPGTPVVAPDGYVIVGYVTSWGNRIPDPTYLTHINYAFGKVDSDFETLKISGESRLKKIVALKSSHPQLKVVLSIGGWGAGNGAGNIHLILLGTSLLLEGPVGEPAPFGSGGAGQKAHHGG